MSEYRGTQTVVHTDVEQGRRADHTSESRRQQLKPSLSLPTMMTTITAHCVAVNAAAAASQQTDGQTE